MHADSAKSTTLSHVQVIDQLLMILGIDPNLGQSDARNSPAGLEMLSAFCGLPLVPSQQRLGENKEIS